MDFSFIGVESLCFCVVHFFVRTLFFFIQCSYLCWVLYSEIYYYSKKQKAKCLKATPKGTFLLRLLKISIATALTLVCLIFCSWLDKPPHIQIFTLWTHIHAFSHVMYQYLMLMSQILESSLKQLLPAFSNALWGFLYYVFLSLQRVYFTRYWTGKLIQEIWAPSLSKI